MDDTKIYKDIVAEVTIDAKMGRRDQAIETRATFFSYDAHSGLVKINLKKDDQPLPIPVGAEVLVSPRKLTGDPGKLVYDNNELDRENGIVYWMIPDQLRGYVGKVRTFVGVRYPNEQRIHGGYFNFSMDISDIDEDVPEWEPYYWQKWEDFQAEAELEWDQWRQAQVDKQDQFEAETTERLDEFVSETNGKMSTLKDDLAEAEANIDQIQEDIASGKVVTETKLVDYWTGEPIVLEGVANFVGKTTGDVATNPHMLHGTNVTSLIPPNLINYENATVAYERVAALDGAVFSDSNSEAGGMHLRAAKWNLIEQINHDHPKLYESVGANDLAAKVAFVKKVLTSFEMTAYGRGSGPTGNKVTSVIWNGADWVYAHTTTAGTITKLGCRLTDPRFLNDDGFMYNLIYAEPSDGTTASRVSLDYAQLVYSLKVSLYDFVPKKSEAMIYRGVYTTGQTLDPDALPKLPGYWEIKGATLNSRFPSGTHNYGVLEQKVSPDGNSIYQNYNPEGTVYSDSVQALDRNSQANGSWDTTNFAPTIGYRFSEIVATHGAQTIGGTKNFLETPMVNSQPLEIAKQARYSITGTSQASAAIAALISDLTMTLTRHGDQVFLAARVNATSSTIDLSRVDIKLFDIPVGYQRANDFVGNATNIACSVARFSTSQVSTNAIAEKLALYFNSSVSGNHYISASWMTDDPFPES